MKVKAFSLGLLFLVSRLYAADANCAKLSVSEGGKCPDIKLSLDLSACSDQLKGEPEISCGNGEATVKAQSKGFTYTATLKETETWGKFTYALAGEVTRTASKAKAEVAAEKPAPKAKPVATPKPAKPAAKEPKKEAKAKVEVAAAPQQKAEPVPAAAPSPVTFGGILDVFYGFNFNRPPSVDSPSTNPLTGNTALRNYDNYHNQFGLSLAELTARKTQGQVQFALDLDFGIAADINATGTNSAGSVTDEVSKHIGQANITFAPEALNGVTFTAGKILSHVGYEGFKAKDNWQYSRSITNYVMPAWHMGLAVNIPVVKDRFSTGLFLYNGWNNLFDNNDGKTFGLQLKVTPNESFAITNNFIGGPENFTNNGKWKIENEMNMTFTANEKWAFAVEGLIGYQSEALASGEDGKWGGTTLHAKYTACKYYWISPRFEYFHDRSGLTLGTANRFIGTTLTNGMPLAEGLETRVELRYDHALDNATFTTHEGDTSKNQFTTTASLLYSF